jgi:hypothetical protein
VEKKYIHEEGVRLKAQDLRQRRKEEYWNDGRPDGR